ncbi:TPA: hypothetical protein QCG56_001796 [Enterobacter cancerogenus]|nr:hypothetical protein [Enterobacter cancerogenus]HDR2164896.1 hypothetical protein [Enterobacter cancerogenus]HDR2267530.1 hypothetical protein [Enterobacter cancerogenus]
MNRMPLSIMIFSLLTLTACSTSQPDKVEQINHLKIPLVLPGEKPAPVQTSHIAALYQTNKQQIDKLTTMVKSDYLQNANAKEIFIPDSPVQRVYASLSKLEQLDMVNQQYLKDKNEAGLQNINIVLQPLIAG